MPVFLTEALLYVLFTASDAGWLRLPLDSNILKFAAVCLLGVWAAAGWVRFRRHTALAAAALLIPPADWGLLFRMDKPLPGMVIFLAVQALYTAHLAREGGGKPVRMAGLRAALFAAGCFGVKAAVPEAGTAEWLAVGYILVFVCNAVSAVRTAAVRRTEETVRFAAGVILFLLCDVHVGLFNVEYLLSGGLRAYAEGFAGLGMWLFYLPGQYLISSLPAGMTGRGKAREVRKV